MSRVILPESVGYRLEAEAALEHISKRVDWLRYFDRALKDIDGCLSLVKAKEDAEAVGIIPGYWHIKRDNPATDPSFLPIQGPKGEFIEPHSGILDDLRRQDLQRPGALEQLRASQAKEIADNQKVIDLGRLERVEEMAARMKAIDSPGVSFGTNRWTKSRAGRRAK